MLLTRIKKVTPQSRMNTGRRPFHRKTVEKKIIQYDMTYSRLLDTKKPEPR